MSKEAAGLRIAVIGGAGDLGGRVELITHLAFYSGWPTASTALSIARHVFDGRKV